MNVEMKNADGYDFWLVPRGIHIFACLIPCLMSANTSINLTRILLLVSHVTEIFPQIYRAGRGPRSGD